jgi:hypothetical protein
MAKNKEQVDSKVEQLNGSQPSSSSGKEQPSKSVKKESWYEMAMHNDKEQEASRSMFKGSESSKTSPNEIAMIAFSPQGAANQVDWRVAMVADMIAKTEPLPGDGSTFLAKRKC